MATDNTGLIGSVLGECRLERLIGKGGMSSVYLGRQVRPARYVAVKVLDARLITNDAEDYQSFLIRFRREADIVARLEHVNIVPVYAYGEQQQLAYIIMPYISGGSLSDLIKKEGKLSLQETLLYLQQAAAALDYAHARNVVHRDLKPSNFLLYPEDNRLVLADFGIARMTSENPYATHETTLTQDGTIPGTLAYMAPEMLRDGKHIDYRVDIYALGIVLYQMLSGELPFRGDLYSLINKHLSEPLPSLHMRAPAIPAAIDAVLRKATAKDREGRYASAGELARDFRLAMQGNALDTTPSTGPGDNETTAPSIRGSIPPRGWNPPTPAAPLTPAGGNGPVSFPGSDPVYPSFVTNNPPAPIIGEDISRRSPASNPELPPRNPSTTPYSPIPTAPTGQPYAPQPSNYQQSERIPYRGDSPPFTPAPAYNPPASPRRRPHPFALILLIAVVLLAGLLLSIWVVRRNSTPPVSTTATATVTSTAKAQQVIQDYYTSINQRNYRAAFNLLTPQFQSYLGYNNFVNGYANTKHDDISFGETTQISAGVVDVVTTINALETRPQGDVTTTYRFRYRVVRLAGNWKIQSGVAV